MGADHSLGVYEIPGGLYVWVGRPRHPMTEAHRILWIEAVVGDRTLRRFLDPGDPPEAVFEVAAGRVTVRACCSVDGLWVSSRPRKPDLRRSAPQARELVCS